MKIEVGKYYRMRCGGAVKIEKYEQGYLGNSFTFWDDDKSGRWLYDTESFLDLIAEIDEAEYNRIVSGEQADLYARIEELQSENELLKKQNQTDAVLGQCAMDDAYNRIVELETETKRILWIKKINFVYNYFLTMSLQKILLRELRFYRVMHSTIQPTDFNPKNYKFQFTKKLFMDIEGYIRKNVYTEVVELFNLSKKVSSLDIFNVYMNNASVYLNVWYYLPKLPLPTEETDGKTSPMVLNPSKFVATGIRISNHHWDGKSITEAKPEHKQHFFIDGFSKKDDLENKLKESVDNMIRYFNLKYDVLVRMKQLSTDDALFIKNVESFKDSKDNYIQNTNAEEYNKMMKKAQNRKIFDSNTTIEFKE